MCINVNGNTVRKCQLFLQVSGGGHKTFLCVIISLISSPILSHSDFITWIVPTSGGHSILATGGSELTFFFQVQIGNLLVRSEFSFLEMRGLFFSVQPLSVQDSQEGLKAQKWKNTTIYRKV
jgi:hypothetical protein